MNDSNEIIDDESEHHSDVVDQDEENEIELYSICKMMIVILIW